MRWLNLVLIFFIFQANASYKDFFKELNGLHSTQQLIKILKKEMPKEHLEPYKKIFTDAKFIKQLKAPLPKVIPINDYEFMFVTANETTTVQFDKNSPFSYRVNGKIFHVDPHDPLGFLKEYFPKKTIKSANLPLFPFHVSVAMAGNSKKQIPIQNKLSIFTAIVKTINEALKEMNNIVPNIAAISNTIVGTLSIGCPDNQTCAMTLAAMRRRTVDGLVKLIQYDKKDLQLEAGFIMMSGLKPDRCSVIRACFASIITLSKRVLSGLDTFRNSQNSDTSTKESIKNSGTRGEKGNQ